MSSVISYPARFIIDEFFIEDILKDKQKASRILAKLSEIHTTSKDYPLKHNISFDDCFKNAIQDKQIRGPALLGVFSPEPYPQFVQKETDFESKIIKYAINLATKRPWNIVILTSDEQEKKYKSNAHYSENREVQSVVKIMCGETALRIIDIVLSYKS